MRIALSLALVAVASAVGWVLLGAGAEDETEASPGRAELVRLQERLARLTDSGELGRQGIYVLGSGFGRARCLAVDLANPTRPNVEYIERHFRGACVDRTVRQRAQGCSEQPRAAVPSGDIAVPDIRHLPLYEAQRELVKNGLTFTFDCLGDRRRQAEQPGVGEPESLARIAAQCPQPGFRVPAGTEVALDARARLPGGYVFRRSALNFYNTGTNRPCRDGVNAAPLPARD